MSIMHSLSAALPIFDLRPTGQIEQEIVDELEFNLAMRTEDNMNQGMPANAARTAALAQFGDFAKIRRNCRRALLGARIMWQRIQIGVSIVLVCAVVLLAVQFYNGQRANKAAIDQITSTLKQLAPVPAGGAAFVAGEKESKADTQAAPDPGQAYPTKIARTYEFKSLAVDFGKLKLSGEAITVVPISTEVGVTGAVLLGNGQYTYTAEAGKDFTGHFRAALLRFNPKDADSIIKLSAGKAGDDKGARELARTVIGATFRHCYHAGGNALIPPERTIAANVFSRELGDVLFSGDDKTAVVYNFTDRKQLYGQE